MTIFGDYTLFSYICYTGGTIYFQLTDYHMDKNLTDEEQEFLNLLGKRIFNLRQEQELTQEEMALELDTGHTQVSRLENGRVNPKLTTLLKVAEVLGVSVSELTNFNEN